MKKLTLTLIALLVAGFVYAQVTKDVTITVEASIASDVIDAYAWQFDFENAKLEGETKAQFAVRMFTEQAQANIRSTYKSYMTSKGAQEAAIAADSASLGITVQ